MGNLTQNIANSVIMILFTLIADEADQDDSLRILDKLHEIDGETENLDITFVRMSDVRYARKWGVLKLPALVYFRKRFPSIYRSKYFLNLIAFLKAL